MQECIHPDRWVDGGTVDGVGAANLLGIEGGEHFPEVHITLESSVFREAEW